MSSLLFFSGGIDSAVLAAVIAKHPQLYGIGDKENVILLVHGDKTKVKRLKTLAATIFGDRPYDFEVMDSGLYGHDTQAVPEEGHQGQPLVTRWAADRDSCPYTSGLHMAMAAQAVNVLSFHPKPARGYRTAFWGFQEDNLAWEAQDAGKGPKNDASEAWLAALNALMAQSPSKTRFRAPFLESRASKYQIVQLGQQLGVPWHLTSSCISGEKACGHCWQCNRRTLVFKHLGITE